jgi:hypothetical protein
MLAIFVPHFGFAKRLVVRDLGSGYLVHLVVQVKVYLGYTAKMYFDIVFPLENGRKRKEKERERRKKREENKKS